MKIISKSVEETIALGKKLGKTLKAGSVVALIGDLGSGKTVFTKGIAEALGVRHARYVNSPTFVLIKEYKGRVPLYHFDLYRLNRYSSFDELNYDEYFYGDGVTVIEWADKILKFLPKKHVQVKFRVIGESKRRIKVSSLREGL